MSLSTCKQHPFGLLQRNVRPLPPNAATTDCTSCRCYMLLLLCLLPILMVQTHTYTHATHTHIHTHTPPPTHTHNLITPDKLFLADMTRANDWCAVKDVEISKLNLSCSRALRLPYNLALVHIGSRAPRLAYTSAFVHLGQRALRLTCTSVLVHFHFLVNK